MWKHGGATVQEYSLAAIWASTRQLTQAIFRWPFASKASASRAAKDTIAILFPIDKIHIHITFNIIDKWNKSHLKRLYIY